MSQWLRLGAFTAMGLVQALFGELKPCKPRGTTNNNNNNKVAFPADALKQRKKQTNALSFPPQFSIHPPVSIILKNQ